MSRGFSRESEMEDEGFPFFAEEFHVRFAKDGLEGMESGVVVFGIGKEFMVILYQ